MTRTENLNEIGRWFESSKKKTVDLDHSMGCIKVDRKHRELKKILKSSLFKITLGVTCLIKQHFAFSSGTINMNSLHTNE